jgi:hypothetical protein
LSDEFSIYPNPVLDELNVETGDHESEYTMSIISSNGALIKSLTLPAPQTKLNIDARDLMPGIYIINIYGNPIHKTFKFLKSN